MRGKGKPTSRNDFPNGITPAYAGKSRRLFCGFVYVTDHPRLCGEKNIEMISKISHHGSPPPMRGKVRVGEAYSRAYRITPAYAGKR